MKSKYEVGITILLQQPAATDFGLTVSALNSILFYPAISGSSQCRIIQMEEILTVSQLNNNIKFLLEETFGSLLVEGEVSNLRGRNRDMYILP